MLTSFSDLDAVFKDSEINLVEFVAKLLLLHEFILFPVGADNVAALNSSQK